MVRVSGMGISSYQGFKKTFMFFLNPRDERLLQNNLSNKSQQKSKFFCEMSNNFFMGHSEICFLLISATDDFLHRY